MAAQIPRYLIENHGPDQKVVKTAFASAFQVCAENAIPQVTLLVPAKGAFPTTVVGTFLGEGVTRALCKGQTVKITSDLSMNLESLHTFSPYKSYGMVIGVYLSPGGQNTLDSTTSAQAIMLLPWTEEEGKSWMSTWNPTILGESTWQVSEETLAPDVEDALLTMTRMINLSTGLTHPSDKESAKRTLSELKRAGHRPTPEEIRKWALRHAWRPKDAEALGKLAARHFK